MDYLKTVSIDEKVSAGEKTFSGRNLDFLQCFGLLLNNADFSNCNMRNSNWAECDLSAANLERVGCTDSLFSECNLKNTEMSRGDFRRTVFDHCDISEIVVRGGNYSYSSFSHCNLKNMDWEGASAEKAGFTKCDLSGSKIKGAIFERVRFEDCDLSGQNYANLNITYARFNRCKIDGLRVNYNHFHTLKGLWHTDWEKHVIVSFKGNTPKGKALRNELNHFEQLLFLHKMYFSVINLRLLTRRYTGTGTIIADSIEHCMTFNLFDMLADIAEMFFENIALLSSEITFSTFDSLLFEIGRRKKDDVAKNKDIAAYSGLVSFFNTYSILKKDFLVSHEDSIPRVSNKWLMPPGAEYLDRKTRPDVKVIVQLHSHELSAAIVSEYCIVLNVLWGHILSSNGIRLNKTNCLKISSMSAGSFLFELYTAVRENTPLLVLLPVYLHFLTKYLELLNIKKTRKDIELQSADQILKYFEVSQKACDMVNSENAEHILLSDGKPATSHAITQRDMFIALFPNEAKKIYGKLDRKMKRSCIGSCLVGIKRVFIDYYGKPL